MGTINVNRTLIVPYYYPHRSYDILESPPKPFQNNACSLKTFALQTPKKFSVMTNLNIYSCTVRGKNKRLVTKFYNSYFYESYENYFWGESNLY